MLTGGSYDWRLRRRPGPWPVVAAFEHGLHAALPSGLILSLTEQGPQGPLTVTLARREAHDPTWTEDFRERTVGSGPYGVRLELIFSSERAAISPDRRTLRVDLRRASPWGRRSPPAAQVSPEVLLANAEALMRAAWARSAFSLESLVGDSLRARRIQVLEAIHCLDAPRLRAAFGRTLGLGPGLTPAGDDWAAGLALALRRLSAGSEEGQRSVSTVSFALRVTAATRRTTSFARTVVELACVGEASSTALAAVEDLAGPTQCRGFEPLLTLGHTSGADMGVGIADGARLVAKHNGQTPYPHRRPFETAVA